MGALAHRGLQFHRRHPETAIAADGHRDAVGFV